MLFEEDDVTWGQVSQVLGTFVTFQKAELVPMTGLVLGNTCSTLELLTEDDADHFKPFDWFGFADCHERRPEQFIQRDGSSVWIISEFDKAQPLNVGHVFSGAFNGWHRAIEWMQQVTDVRVDNSFSLDSDSDLLQTWSLDGYEICRDESPRFRSGVKTAVLSSVEQNGWGNLMRNRTNQILTHSPPCVSWSRGGFGDGLLCPSGLSFAEAVKKIKWFRPTIAFFECSDTVPQHKHFRLLQEGLRHAGYTCAWSTVSELAAFSPMMRARWLSVWIRNDVHLSRAVGTFKLYSEFLSWTHPDFNFKVPESVQLQLYLRELVDVYGDPKLLPHGFSRSLPEESTIDQVLRQRVPKANAPLPTLCASYSSQHQIVAHHIEKKGIYGAVVQTNGEWSFLDPLKFCALLGASDAASIHLPCNVQLAFRFLGNAIALGHAVVVLSVGLNISGLADLATSELVRLGWNTRVKADKAFVFVTHEFVSIVPVDRFSRDCIIHYKETDGDALLCTSHAHVKVSSHFTIAEFFLACGLDDEQISSLQFYHKHQRISCDSQIGSLSTDHVLVKFGDSQIFSFWIRQESEPLTVLSTADDDQENDCGTIQIAGVTVETTEWFQLTVETNTHVRLQILQHVKNTFDHHLVRFAHEHSEVVFGAPACVITDRNVTDIACVVVPDGHAFLELLPVDCTIGQFRDRFEKPGVIHVNGVVPLDDLILHDGDIISFLDFHPSKRRKIANVNERADQAISCGLAMGFDEMLFFTKCQGAAFLPPFEIGKHQKDAFSALVSKALT